MIKNTTNYTVAQLVDKLKEVCEKKEYNDPTYKWAYITGTLEAILDFEVKGYGAGITTLQEQINNAYLRYENELLQAA